MSNDPVIAAADAARAIRALLPMIADVMAAAADMSAAADVLARSQELASLCRDAAALADTVTLIIRRSQP